MSIFTLTIPLTGNRFFVRPTTLPTTTERVLIDSDKFSQVHNANTIAIEVEPDRYLWAPLAGDYLFVGPSSLMASAQRAFLYAKNFGNCHERNNSSPKLNPNGVSLVTALLACRSPNTIFGTVIAVIFNSLDRMTWGWLQTHVGEKVFKRIFPSLAYRNASSAIIRKARMFWIGTTSLHISPSKMFGRIVHSMSKAAGSAVASARNDLAGPQVSTEDCFTGPAFAEAIPSCLTGIGNNGVSAKLSSSQVDEIRGLREWLSYHLRRFSMVVHIGFSGWSELHTPSSRASIFTP